MFDKIKRYCLALCIRCPRKAKTKGDILRYALRFYLTDKAYALCNAIYKATVRFQYKRDVIGINYAYEKIPLVFPLFCYKIAVENYNASGRKSSYWWPIKDWKSRYRYMKWLIKEYDNEKL